MTEQQRTAAWATARARAAARAASAAAAHASTAAMSASRAQRYASATNHASAEAKRCLNRAQDALDAAWCAGAHARTAAVCAWAARCQPGEADPPVDTPFDTLDAFGDHGELAARAKTAFHRACHERDVAGGHAMMANALVRRAKGSADRAAATNRTPDEEPR